MSPVTSGSAILVDPGGSTLLPGEGGPKFCPDVLEDDLVLGAAVLLPAVWDTRVASSTGEVLVGNCDVTTDGNITAGRDGWSAPEMVGLSSGSLGWALLLCPDVPTPPPVWTNTRRGYSGSV